jgi:hypothetical protein
MTLKNVAAALLLMNGLIATASASTLQTLAHQPPRTVGLPLLLTDGSVMAQGSSLTDWYRLTPDASGSYVNGTWTQLASLPAASGYVPDAFASAVLADGRVVIVGGEYNQGIFTLTNLGAIYDPVKNVWAMLPAPAGWDFIGDSPSLVLPNGQFIIGNKLDQRVASLDPATLQWTALGSSGKSDFNAEEGWTLLPSGNILTVDVLDAPNSELYVVPQQQWLDAGSTIVNLREPYRGSGLSYGNGQIYNPPGEVGPQILRPDGTVFATGASAVNRGHTAIYHPASSPNTPGTWTAGPNFPRDQAGDCNAVLLPSGNVLVLSGSSTLYEFNGQTLTKEPKASGGSNMMMLPSGQALITGGTVKVYNPDGQYSASWAPAVSNYPAAVTRGSSYLISGTQFNGLSQAAAFGDEEETATNYPMVRITNVASGHVFYARTHDHSSMGVATGSLNVSTHFDVPSGIETGASKLEVVANGIPSVAVAVTVQ